MSDREALRRKIYPEAKREDDRAVSPYIYYVLRPVSVAPTLWLHRLGFTATGCTLISGVLMLLGALLIAASGALAASTWTAWIVGALLINVYLYLDVLDGNLARLTGTSSKAGEFLDCTLNAIAGWLVPAAIGVGLYLSGGDAASQLLLLSPGLLLAMALAIGVLRLFRRVVTDHASRLVGAAGDRANVLGASRRGPRYWASVINSSATVALLPVGLLGVPSVWLLFYFLFNLGVATYSLHWAYRRIVASEAKAASVQEADASVAADAPPVVEREQREVA